MMQKRNGRIQAGRRGIGVIVGEILLILITVVLAGILAIAASGLMRAPNAPPIGYNLAIFASGTGGGSSSTGSGSGFGPVGGAPTYQYSFMLAYSSPGITLGDLMFQIQTAQSAVVNAAGLTLSVEGLSQNVVATYYFSTATWHAGPGVTSNPTSLAITTENSLVVTSPTSLSGDTLIIFGQNSYSGQVSAGFP
jgi:hypothetical protein